MDFWLGVHAKRGKIIKYDVNSVPNLSISKIVKIYNMKEHSFGTNKGNFVLTDQNENGKVIHPGCCFRELGRLKDMAEEQAKKVVDNCHAINAVESLHLLIKSFGIELFKNPYKGHEDKDLELFYEDCTFYNPILFEVL